MKEAFEVKKEYLIKTEEEWDIIFRKREDTINEAIAVYLELKRLYNRKEDSLFFRWLFMAYYGMRGRLNKERQERFFSYFGKDLKSPLVVNDIVNYINDNKKSSGYFSFVTKMLNMYDETLYPIYDSRMAIRAFGCDPKTEMNLNSKEKCYNRIKMLYNSILDSDPAIISFKSNFPQAESLGKMRILDFIVYNTL